MRGVAAEEAADDVEVAGVDQQLDPLRRLRQLLQRRGDDRQDELATNRQRLADQLPAEHQREVEHLVHQPLLVLADGGVERGQQRCQAGALGAGLREAGGVAGGATLGQRRGAHRRELGFARRLLVTVAGGAAGERGELPALVRGEVLAGE